MLDLNEAHGTSDISSTRILTYGKGIRQILVIDKRPDVHADAHSCTSFDETWLPKGPIDTEPPRATGGLWRAIRRQLGFWWHRERPASRARVLLLALHTFSDIDPRADLFHVERIRLGPNVQIGARAMLNFKSGRTPLPPHRSWNLSIGEGSKIMPDAKLIPQQGFIQIGAHCSVQYGALLYGVGGLTIGDHTRIAAGTIITPMNHTFSDRSRPIWQQPETAKGIVIGRDCWIGAGVRIVDGVTLGDGCVVGAGSVVTKSFEPYSVLAGVPARVIGSRVSRELSA